MPNRAMEFHDSTFDRVERVGADLALHFSAAYIHESEGEPGVDAGSGWVQGLRLHISDASLNGQILHLPCKLWGGSICLGEKQFENALPIPLDYQGHVKVTLGETSNLTVTGTGLRVELCGQPKYVEEFPGQ